MLSTIQNWFGRASTRTQNFLNVKKFKSFYVNDNDIIVAPNFISALFFLLNKWHDLVFFNNLLRTARSITPLCDESAHQKRSLNEIQNDSFRHNFQVQVHFHLFLNGEQITRHKLTLYWIVICGMIIDIQMRYRDFNFWIDPDEHQPSNSCSVNNLHTFVGGGQDKNNMKVR